MKLTSTAFADGEKMPQEFAKLGANHIPPLEIDGVPGGTKSLAIIVRSGCAAPGRILSLDAVEHSAANNVDRRR